jgi:hypothetical protein
MAPFAIIPYNFSTVGTASLTLLVLVRRRITLAMEASGGRCPVDVVYFHAAAQM